jgi:hypothetical protein
MKKTHILLILAVAAALGSTVALSVTNNNGTTANNDASSEDVKTVAWYVANIKEARNQNQACHDNPNLQETANCVNSLHALEISFKGNN